MNIRITFFTFFSKSRFKKRKKSRVLDFQINVNCQRSCRPTSARNHILVADLSLEKRSPRLAQLAFSFRQLRRIRKSLDDGSAATLAHTFVTSRLDYCNALYAGAPKTVTDKLHRVLNAAARVVSDTRKFDRGLTTL